MNSWAEIIGAVGAGGGITGLFNYLRNSKRDASQAKINMQQEGATQLMQVWTTLTKEQHDWRAMLMHRIQELESKTGELTVEKNQLTMRIAELEIHNRELMEDNQALSAQVAELKSELETYKAKVSDGDDHG